MFSNDDWEQMTEIDLCSLDYDVRSVNVKDSWLNLDEGTEQWHVILSFTTGDGESFDGVEMTYCYDTEDFLNIEF